jgi:RNA polymerase sigma-70 factor (ECF subfamily)
VRPAGGRSANNGSDDIDVVMVVQAQNGDPVALEQLVRRLVPYVGRICGAIARDDGDDALQETMLAIVRHLPALREPAAIRGWAKQIAVRKALAAVQPNRRGQQSLEQRDEHGTAADDLGTAVAVRGILSDMPHAQREILVMRDVIGAPEAQIAAWLKVPLGTVKSRVHRARSAFRDRWSA